MQEPLMSACSVAYVYSLPMCKVCADVLVYLQVFTLTLAICLSAGSQKPGSVFSVSEAHLQFLI